MLYLCVYYHDDIAKAKCLAPIRHAQSYSNVHKSLPLDRLSLLSAGLSCFALLHFFIFVYLRLLLLLLIFFLYLIFHFFTYLFIFLFLFFYYCQIIKFYLYLYWVVVRMYGFSIVAEGETDKSIFWFFSLNPISIKFGPKGHV